MARLTDNRFKKAFDMTTPRWTTILALSIGILAMTTLTVKDLFPIMSDYLDDNENSQVQIKVRRSDEEFRAPDLHMCIPLQGGIHQNFTSDLIDYLEHGEECPMCEAMANHTFDVWNPLAMRPNESIIALYEAYQEELRKRGPRASALLGNVPSDVTNVLQRAFVQRVLELENDTTRNGFHRNQMFMRAKNNGINMGNISWNRPVVNSIVEYLMMQSMREKSLLFQARFQTHGSGDTPLDPPVSKSSLDALYSTLTMFVCESLWVINGTSITDQNDCNDFIGNASLVLSESFSPFFCMRIPLDNVQELSILMPSDYFDRYMGSRRKFLIMTENPTYPPRTSPLPTSHLYVSPESDLSLRSVEEVTIAYSVQYNVVEARPRMLKTCYIESSKSECELNCYVDQLDSICGCRSYMFRRRSLSRKEEGYIAEVDAKYCADADFRACTQRISNYTGRDICAEKCADACQSTAYQWQVSSTTRSNYGQSLKLSIQNRQQSFLEFTMRVKDHSPDLTSEIGGVCNIYLGLNGLSIILFLIYLCESARRWLRLWRKEEKEEEDGTGVQERRSSKVAWPWSHRVNVSIEGRLEKLEKHLVELSAAFRVFQESSRKNEMK